MHNYLHIYNKLQRDFKESLTKNKTRRGFGKFNRKLVFFLIFFINILINLDHGAIPAGTTKLMSDLDLDHVYIGMIGSFVFLGLTIGASIAGFMFNNYTPKWVVCGSILSSSFFLYCFTQSKTFFILGLSRIFCGFFQVIFKIIFI